MNEIEQDTQAPFRAPVVRSTVVVLGVILASVLVVLGSLVWLRGHTHATERDAWRRVPDQVSALELKGFVTPPALAKDRARLRQFGWVDRKKHLVHVPIDVAMELYLKREEQTR